MSPASAILPPSTRWNWTATAVHRTASRDTETDWHAAIVIPARNEEQRIAGALEAAASSLKAQDRHGGIVVFVNDTSDRTFDRAVTTLRSTAVPHLVIDADMPGGLTAAGYARLAGCEAALGRLADGGLLLTSDADTIVPREWVAANARILETADVVFGRIEFDRAELAALPKVVRERIRTETEYRQWTTRLAHALDPGLDPLHAHGFSGGASIGCRAAAYVEIGGIPPVAAGEDCAFAERAFAHDLRVVRSPSVRVTTSCRLRGRAAGGMADTWTRWTTDPDILCDVAFEPPSSAYLRAWARARLRSSWREKKGAQAILRLLGIFTDECDLYDRPRFGQAWEWVERRSAPLRRSPMTFGELDRALPELRRLAILAASQPDPSREVAA